MRVLFCITANDSNQYLVEETALFTYCKDREHEGLVYMRNIHGTGYYSTERVNEGAFGTMAESLLRNGYLEISVTKFIHDEE